MTIGDCMMFEGLGKRLEWRKDKVRSGRWPLPLPLEAASLGWNLPFEACGLKRPPLAPPCEGGARGGSSLG